MVGVSAPVLRDEGVPGVSGRLPQAGSQGQVVGHLLPRAALPGGGGGGGAQGEEEKEEEGGGGHGEGGHAEGGGRRGEHRKKN